MSSLELSNGLLAEQVKHIKPRNLEIKPHCRKALQRAIDAIEYYLDIYRNGLERLLELCAKAPDEMTIVDYGGGHGLLSVYAKRLGFGNVIYVDNNSESVKMCNVVTTELMTSPDVKIFGDAAALSRWCLENNVVPDAVIGVDVIEHIYVLDDFFATLHSISPSMKMVFTTASNPHNKRIVRRLHHVMKKDENEFRKQRRAFIEKQNPDMPETMLDYWAENTRGLVFEDVARAVDSQSPNLLLDEFNTCDPATGSWTERILPFDDYRQLLKPYGFALDVLPGLYNANRSGIRGRIGRCRNKRIARVQSPNPKGTRQRRYYRKALKLAPFVYLIVTNHQ